MPWIEDEETLLKEKLSHFTVTDQKAPTGRSVGVWFRFPEMELTPDRERRLEGMYPFVTIDLINISEALDRAHRGGQMRPTVDGYKPPDYVGPPEGRRHVTDWPIAMNLDYQLTTWTRNIQHDRQIVRQFWTLFPGRYGYLGGNASPYVRPFSAQLLSGTPAHRIDEFGKRQFRNIFSLRVFSELWASQIKEVGELTEFEIEIPINVAPGEWFSDISCFED
ncbi:MAG TPA: hypothetical protein VFI41_05465 [Gemmatimonadales bacterium]|nr:hypothetical protein [Gemmatimonadales bacterium]